MGRFLSVSCSRNAKFTEMNCECDSRKILWRGPPATPPGSLGRLGPVFLHLCPRGDWESRPHLDRYEPPSLASSGFVHLSTPEQVHLPANRLFAGRRDLLLLTVDPSLLPDAAVRWEPGLPEDPAGMVFPHLYAPLPARAVTGVEPYRPGPDGGFAPLGPPRP